MPDEEITTATVQDAPPQEEGPVVTPEVHPLEPGGTRFNEVYRDMQDARRESARLQGELEGLRRQSTQQPQQPQFYTPQQLQGEVDAGWITPAVMVAQIGWQERQIAKQEMRLEISQTERFRAAGTEVQKYLNEIPKLADTGSEEFRRVNVVNREIADEMQLPVDDLRVQRRALQIVFGPVERLAKGKVVSDATRVGAETYVESGGGGAKGAPSKDPLKDIPSSYKTHWERLGYTREQMVEEARWIRPTPRQRAGLWKP